MATASDTTIDALNAILSLEETIQHELNVEVSIHGASIPGLLNLLKMEIELWKSNQTPQAYLVIEMEKAARVAATIRKQEGDLSQLPPKLQAQLADSNEQLIDLLLALRALNKTHRRWLEQNQLTKKIRVSPLNGLFKDLKKAVEKRNKIHTRLIKLHTQLSKKAA